MTNSAEAILFDLDGTLVDSAGGIAAALNESLAAHGLAPFAVAAVAAMVGGGVRRLIERALESAGAGGDARLVDDTLARFLAAYRAAPTRASPLFPEARETLRAFADSGIRLGVVTNKPDDISRLILVEHGVAPFFGSIVGSLPGRALKPAPDMIAIALAELGVGGGNAILIGDSKADVGAARAFGISVILLAHGYSHGDVHALGADAVAAGFGSLPAALAQVRARARIGP